MGLIYDPAFTRKEKHHCEQPEAKRYSYDSIWQCNDCGKYWCRTVSEWADPYWERVTPFHVVQWYRIWKATR